MKETNKINCRINSSLSADDEWQIVKNAIANCVCVINSTMSYIDGKRA